MPAGSEGIDEDLWKLLHQKLRSKLKQQQKLLFTKFCHPPTHAYTLCQLWQARKDWSTYSKARYKTTNHRYFYIFASELLDNLPNEDVPKSFHNSVYLKKNKQSPWWFQKKKNYPAKMIIHHVYSKLWTESYSRCTWGYPWEWFRSCN